MHNWFLILVVAVSALAGDDTAKVVFPDGTVFICVIADTPYERATGLSRHETLAPESGMLFVYPQPRLVSFWMPPRMKFNLDLIFLDSNCRVIHVDHDAPPCPDSSGWNCPSYGPENTPSSFVVEVIGGTARNLGIQVGDVIRVIPPDGYQKPSK